ncbi:unnamed protein product [Rhizophagus irregularis]|nr:unnamed protein product [Rhizophagus irregularis]
MSSVDINEVDIIYEEDLIMKTITEEEENAEIYITKYMTVKTIILHSLTPLEYPLTSEDGIAIIYHIEGWQNVDSAFTDDQTCRELKICEFASPELLEITHKSVDPNSDLCLKMSKKLSDNNLKNNTFAN